jgi:hypothetical protein
LEKSTKIEERLQEPKDLVDLAAQIGDVDPTVSRDRRQRMDDSNHSWDTKSGYSVEETSMALRNHGMHQEALAQDITPVGMHYLLQHFDVQ